MVAISNASRQIAFRRWMRRVGVKVWFLINFIFLWELYNAIFVEEIREPPPFISEFSDLDFREHFENWVSWIFHTICQDLGFYQLSLKIIIESYGYDVSLWLFFIRLHGLVYSYITYVALLCFFGPSLPDPYLEDAPQGDRSCQKRQPVHCVCVRILTIGDAVAQPLVRKAVSAAVSILNEMCACEHLKVHLVTQTHFLDDATKTMWRRAGATEVQELFVPSTYSTRNGTLYKARNICYWEDMGGVGRNCDETKSWILSLDEEAIITRPLVASFIKEVLSSEHESRIGYALGSFCVDVHSVPTAFMTKMMEARIMALGYAWLKHRMSNDEGILCFRGGSYFVRASVDRQVGNDWGPKISVADDHAIGIVAKEKKIGFRYLDGWFIDGTAPTLWGFITHGARVFRGQIYCAIHIPMGRRQKFMQICRLLAFNATALFQVLMLTFVLIDPPAYAPAGARCSLLDLIFIFHLAGQSAAYVYGATYMRISDKEMIACVLLSPMMVLIFQPVIELIMTIWGLVCTLKDWRRGTATYEVTARCVEKCQ